MKFHVLVGEHDGWYRNLGSKYAVVLEPADYDTAVTKCGEINATLVRIYEKVEMEFIKEVLAIEAPTVQGGLLIGN